jgi:hypothetical protein
LRLFHPILTIFWQEKNISEISKSCHGLNEGNRRHRDRYKACFGQRNGPLRYRDGCLSTSTYSTKYRAPIAKFINSTAQPQELHQVQYLRMYCIHQNVSHIHQICLHQFYLSPIKIHLGPPFCQSSEGVTGNLETISTSLYR